MEEAIAVAVVANKHAYTIWFIFFDKKERVHIYEVTDGYGNKVAPGQSFISGRILEHSVTSETHYVFPQKTKYFYKESLVYPFV